GPPAAAGTHRRVVGASASGAMSDLPGAAAGRGMSPFHKIDPPRRVVQAFAMYLVLVVVILVGQMGNLPWWSGHPVNDPKTALHAPANRPAGLKYGSPSFAPCLPP